MEKTTVAQAVLHTFQLKRRIDVFCMFLKNKPICMRCFAHVLAQTAQYYIRNIIFVFFFAKQANFK